ncbi:hypothetical protein B0T44_24200 [Nocardia donostiensis]|uniref:Uncharacterized protein n=1 Tax=Nocardia donostiensis TaxID=1538463 RepID=A0A1V2TF60_9NOCA|nr:hypothetical protein B0T46_14320 [Nocardia donostiensis]OQS13848.1 hypothetical protein B0T36_17060 [Nocardia donostiensis]OQS17552.1 hypothetical protein B0T44_24200 [Nocardia donostiensis]
MTSITSAAAKASSTGGVFDGVRRVSGADFRSGLPIADRVTSREFAWVEGVALEGASSGGEGGQ